MIPLGEGPVVCVGETMVSLVPEHSGGDLAAADSLRLAVAGAESNVAMYLADHGVPVRWVSAVGDDPFGRRVVAEVAARGVDVSGVRTDPARPTGLMVKSPGEHGTHVHYYRRGSAASALGPAVLDDPAVRTAGLLHLTGITAALSHSCRALVDAALRGPVPVSFDVNHRPALWPDGPVLPPAERICPHPSQRTDESAAAVLYDFADRADLVLVGLDEAQALWDDALADAAAVRALLPRPRVLVVKDGARAATVFDGTDVHTVPARAVDVVEPVGAGDAFAAGFLTGLLRGESPVRALRLGHLTAGAALRVTGDHGPLPDPALIERLLAADDAVWASAVADGDLPVH
ncbi:sugar kinase [Actinacidiphila alni]|uniref:sugar kinase n=1 Tax=Actinacidiphila alni TaxID=380248 RepID=UPI00345156D0